MSQWEYLTRTEDEPLAQDDLIALGEDRWELTEVLAIPHPYSGRERAIQLWYYFKRQKSLENYAAGGLIKEARIILAGDGAGNEMTTTRKRSDPPPADVRGIPLPKE